jgi:alanine dehydrogenase
VIAAGIGAGVIVLEKEQAQIELLRSMLPGITCAPPARDTLESIVPRADVLIGAVHIPGARAPCLITRDLVGRMEPGSVIVDIAIDQGGCIETSRPTTHSEPTFVDQGVIHYCVANMPGIYPRTATLALTRATLPYIRELADKGEAAFANRGLLRGLNIYKGKVVNRAVAQAFDMPYADESVLRNLRV